MKQRIIYGFIYVVILLGMTTYNMLTFDMLYVVFMLIGLYEFHNMCGGSVTNIFYSSMISLYACTYFLMPSVFDASTLLLLLFFGFVMTLLRPKVNSLKVIAVYLASLIYVTVPFWLTLKIGHDHGIEYVVGVFLLIWLNDSFAYLTGNSFGKNKLFPSVSPKKTIEGLIGGITISALLGYGIFYFTDKFSSVWLLIILVVAITANLGDLIQSSFKRSFEIKDTGKIIPGHGGILDRLDSYIYTVPFVYFLLN